jgi:hypothetical protein
MSEQPGNGGIGQSWFVVEVTAEHVPEPDSIPVGLVRNLPYKVKPLVGPQPEILVTVGISRAINYSVEPTLAPEPPGPGFAGGGRPLTSGGGPLFEPIEFEQKIPSTIEISLPAFSQTVSGKISAVRSFDQAIPVEIAMVKEFELRLTGARESSQRWGNLLREDEELLLLI